MLNKLIETDFERVWPLFTRMAGSQPMCVSVLDGIYPGSVYVDDLNAPRSAYLQTYIDSEQSPQWGFLGGDPGNTAFNQALNQALFRREIIHPDAPLVMFTCESQTWAGGMAEIIQPHQPIRLPRRHYICRQFEQDWQAAIPDGFSIEPIGTALLRGEGLDIPDEVRQTIIKWQNMPHPEFRDFGFAAIDNASNPGAVAAWATVDFIAREMGDLGMFTRETYRKRGLAYLTTAAAISHGLAHGLKQINWTCDDENDGSVHTAEKLGLVRAEDYDMYLLFFDPQEHATVLASLEHTSG